MPRELAQALCDNVTDLLALFGLSPGIGEFPDAYAARLTAALTPGTKDAEPAERIPPIRPILDALAKHNVKAAFFVVGNYIEQNPDLVRRMLREGHLVGNHTYHHYDMSKLSDEAAFSRELTSLEDLYREVTGEQMQKYYRPPQGIYSEKNLEMAQKLGYRTVFWSLAYVDWYQDNQPTDEQAFSKLLPRIHPGAVVLLHSTSQTNARILDTLLTKWEEMGYTFGTLDELYA